MNDIDEVLKDYEGMLGPKMPRIPEGVWADIDPATEGMNATLQAVANSRAKALAKSMAQTREQLAANIFSGAGSGITVKITGKTATSIIMDDLGANAGAFDPEAKNAYGITVKGNHPKALWPGIENWFKAKYNA